MAIEPNRNWSAEAEPRPVAAPVAAKAGPSEGLRGWLASFPSLFTMTDEQAMWRVQTQDDPEAFARLMERWQEPIRRLCTRMVGDEHRAEDLTQEAFTRLFGRRKTYRPEAKFSTYLWRIALNLCYDELRRLKRRAETRLEPEDEENGRTSGLTLVSADPTPAEHAHEGERAALVRRALMALPEIYRSVVVLRHYEDLKFGEIAEVLGIPEGTVKSRMSEAMTQLSRWLTPRLDGGNTEGGMERV